MRAGVRYTAGVYVALAVLAVAGCSSGASPSEPATLSPSASRTRTATPTVPVSPSTSPVLSSAEQVAVAAVERSYRRLLVVNDLAAQTGDINVDDFRAVAGDPALAVLIENALYYKNNGLIQRGNVQVDTLDVESIDLNKKTYSTVKLSACLDVSRVQVFVKRTGKLATAPRQHDRITMPVTAWKVDGNWRIVEADVGKNPKPC